MRTYTFKPSSSWDDKKSLAELISDSKFVFTHKGHNGDRPRLVLNTPIEGFDVIELDYDKDGITTNGISKFDASWGDIITDSSKDISGFIKDWLFSIDCHEFVIDGFTNAPCEKPTGKRAAIAENREFA